MINFFYISENDYSTRVIKNGIFFNSPIGHLGKLGK